MESKLRDEKGRIVKGAVLNPEGRRALGHRVIDAMAHFLNTPMCELIVLHSEYSKALQRVEGRQEHSPRDQELLASLTAAEWFALRDIMEGGLDKKLGGARRDAVMDRTIGKPTQAVEVSGPDKGPIQQESSVKDDVLKNLPQGVLDEILARHNGG